MPEIKFEIKKHIANLTPDSECWVTELNLISWNGATPKYDIRSWSKDHVKMSKGITLTPDELSRLKKVLEILSLGEE